MPNPGSTESPKQDGSKEAPLGHVIIKMPKVKDKEMGGSYGEWVRG